MAAVSRDWFNTRSGRVLRENLTAYLFLFPAMSLIFIFGIFPVGFAFYVSLHRWRRFPGEYQGLDNYVRALGDFGYVLFFWLALGALVYAVIVLGRMWAERLNMPRLILSFIPGTATTVFLLLFVNWFSLLLPVVLNIPQRIRGQERVTGLFVSEFIASFQTPEVAAAGSLMLLSGGIALLLNLIGWRVLRIGKNLVQAATVLFSVALTVLTLQLTFTEIGAAVEAARAEGNELPIWTQVVIMSAGVLLLAGAYLLWTRAAKEQRDRRLIIGAAAAGLLMVGGFALVTQVPNLMANADRDMLRGYGITLMFVLGTVPTQLVIGLALAYLLFQKIKGKAFFRMMYFLPYITPFVATSIVFGILFSQRPDSPANRLLNLFGIADQKWLLEPTGIFELIFGAGVPDALAGPSLALIVIMLYTAWTYIGYVTVVYLAGLGNISPEIYEAARIDGANEWQIFRSITLPLLSPTTFFLSLIAIIGTFQAFTQIWILRTPAAQSSVDTVGVYIFETVRSTDPNMGYGSAMSMILFIVILVFTLLQNRIASRRVFYG